MLNISETQSTNVVRISGLLKELEVEEKEKRDSGDKYITAKATIKVDQEVNGKMEENEIVVQAYADYLTRDGKVSKLYTNPEKKSGILEWKNEFRSLATCPEDQPELATRVLITQGELSENIWFTDKDEMRTSFNVNAKFMNAQKPSKPIDDEATFELSGVVLNKVREVDRQGQDTGRVKVNFGIVRYGGKLHAVELIAPEGSKADYVWSNWEEGDTVTVTGFLSINQGTEVWYENQGFGDPIKRTKTFARKELIINGGSPAGLEPELSYDSTDIANAAKERLAYAEEKKVKAKSAKKSQTPASGNKFGF